MIRRGITSWDDVELIIDVPRVAQLMGYTVDRVQRLAQKGEIPAFKVGGSWRFAKEALQGWIANKMKEET